MWFFINFIFIFTLVLFASYLLLGYFSIKRLRNYTKRNSYTDYNSVGISPLSPSVSIISPAYNEEKNIVNNAKTLLNLHYQNFEVIIVNDGSKDNTFNYLVESFELEKVNYFFEYKIPTQKVRGIYKSKNPSYHKLLVIDKVNGGKADAINSGINLCRNELVMSIDADSIIEPDSITKLVKPFLEEKKKKVIGTGGVVRILNSCEVKDGVVKAINLPQKFLPKWQALEYTRAFLLGRMAWSQLDGLMIISGAMGMFDRETMIKAGGYDTHCVGEDMEIVLRMRRYMAEQKKEYEVTYIPDPLCWTEVPSDLKSLQSQRTRWTRGLMDALRKHSTIFLNKSYGKLGMLGYPFWLFFEWMAPLIAFLGIVYTVYLGISGTINWRFFLLLYLFVYSFSVFMSAISILFEELTFHKYKRKRDVLRLLGVSFVEPFLYPILSFFAIKANLQYLKGNKGWGKVHKNGSINGTV
jgi:cellulose synthase/poly-beta-1,6-N-acetylglucosamine synthase-like glycosyltransferase